MYPDHNEERKGMEVTCNLKKGRKIVGWGVHHSPLVLPGILTHLLVLLVPGAGKCGGW